MHNPPDGVKVRRELCVCVSERHPVGVEASVLIWLFLSVCAQQGSTESNATNDEEEMKGRKGTRLIFSLFSSTLSVSHPVKCVLTLAAGR